MRSICKRAKVSFNLEVILTNQDFFKEGDNLYNNLRGLIFNKIRTGNSFFNVDMTSGDDLFDFL